MSKRPETPDAMIRWLETNIGPVQTKKTRSSYYKTAFEEKVVHSDKTNTFAVVGTGSKPHISIHNLFNQLTFANQRFAYVSIGAPENRRICINRDTLEITELAIPKAPANI